MAYPPLWLKPSLWDSSGTISPIAGEGDKGVHAFPKDINPKVNVRDRQEFELVYNYITTIITTTSQGFFSVFLCSCFSNFYLDERVESVFTCVSRPVSGAYSDLISCRERSFPHPKKKKKKNKGVSGVWY